MTHETDVVTRATGGHALTVTADRRHSCTHGTDGFGHHDVAMAL
jgi:hypothetical protein